MAGGLMPARRWSAQGELLHQADFVPPAPIDERGCRRDIRSNGWIVTLESVRAFEAGPAAETKLSSFGAGPSRRSAVSPAALLLSVESGPDVFADALVLPPSGGWCPIFSPETVG